MQPGIRTALGSNLTPELYKDMIAKAQAIKMEESQGVKTREEGSSTTLVAALDLALPNGAYLSDCQLCSPSEEAKDIQKAQTLWDLSEELVGEKFPA